MAPTFTQWALSARCQPPRGPVDVSTIKPLIGESQTQHRTTEAFIATCSPDELLGQILYALCPEYQIDAPHLLALRQVVSSAVVAPRKPPALKRTRPDRRIGELGSVHDAPHRSVYGINGPPVLPDQSFYFHHTDPDFEKLLPQADCSRYERTGGPISQAISGRKEVLESQESAQVTCSTPSVVAIAQPNSSTNFSMSQTVMRASCNDACATPSATYLDTPGQHGATEILGANSIPDISTLSQRNANRESSDPRHTSVPIITITSAESVEQGAADYIKLTAVSSSLPRQDSIAVETAGIEDICEPSQPISAPLPCPPPPSDTQDTALSTQPSDIFSQPADFVHFTPPTQESQKLDLSQLDTFDSIVPLYARATKAKNPSRLPLPVAPTPTLGKHVLDTSDTSDGIRHLKRTKLAN